MKLKLKDVITDQFKRSLHNLRFSPGVKAVISWKLLATYKQLNEVFENYEKLRISACEKFAKKDDEGRPVMIPIGPNGLKQYIIEDIAGLDKELAPLQEQEIELPDPSVNVSDLGEDVSLTVEDLIQLVGRILAEG